MNRFLTIAFFILTGFLIAGCGVSYGLTEKTTLADSVKTVRVNFIENRAPYVNPRLSPALTESVRQKIIRQTRLTNTNDDNAHYDIRATITDYSVVTTGVTTGTNGRQQGSINRLNVTVHIVLNRQLENKVDEFDVSKPFDFDAQLTLQSAENTLFDEIIRLMTNEIFNRIFSNW